jgi:hypothetical protein
MANGRGFRRGVADAAQDVMPNLTLSAPLGLGEATEFAGNVSLSDSTNAFTD